MTTDELFEDYRFIARDNTEPQEVSDQDLARLYLEAETEASIRARLILETEDPDICDLVISVADRVKTLHAALCELVQVSFVDSSGNRHPVKLVTTEYLDGIRESRTYPTGTDFDDPIVPSEDWRDATGTPPIYAIQTDRSLRIVPVATQPGTLHVEGYRVPIRDMNDELEIAAVHHRYLTQWVLWRVFSRPESSASFYDPKRAAVALGEFEQYFGTRPDADLRRSTRHDFPFTVTPHFP